MTITTAVFLLSLGVVWPSDRARTRDISADSIRYYIGVLAADSLEGRKVGEPGEWKAGDFIVAAFNRFGLQPKGDPGDYRQAFDFIKETQFGPHNVLAINGVPLEIGVDYQPLPHSTSGDFKFDEIVDVNYGLTGEDSARGDYAGLDVRGKVVLFKRFSPDDTADTPSGAAPTVDSDSAKADAAAPGRPYGGYSGLAEKISGALDHGAAGVFVYTPADRDDTLMEMGSTHVTPKDIPIIYLRRTGLEKLGLSLESPAIRTAEGVTDLVRVRDTGYNVIGFLPGQTDTTVIIGAHYDHLGYGGSSSRYRGPERLIHNGADDNGSGTAALMEIARYCASRPQPFRHSLVLIAFSG